MKKKMIILGITILLLIGCSMSNTPTSKVEDLLSKYQEQDDTNTGGYFQYMEKELKKQERDEKRQERLLKMSQMNNGNIKEMNKSLGRDSLLHNKTFDIIILL